MSSLDMAEILDRRFSKFVERMDALCALLAGAWPLAKSYLF